MGAVSGLNISGGSERKKSGQRGRSEFAAKRFKRIRAFKIKGLDFVSCKIQTLLFWDIGCSQEKKELY
ncbi:hypothetical protein [Pseudoramibacter alactolyticus]|uniref:hypothetical protein n=1 Tax=Pseudoramibacter alactolyticus TaxID=113287 RepID=UPI0028E25689|nr:hypothetical protein [Pseudoramibacter alactolyticus]